MYSLRYCIRGVATELTMRGRRPGRQAKRTEDLPAVQAQTSSRASSFDGSAFPQAPASQSSPPTTSPLHVADVHNYGRSPSSSSSLSSLLLLVEAPIDPQFGFQMAPQSFLRASPRMASMVSRRLFHATRTRMSSPFHYPEGPYSNLPFNTKTRFFAVRYWLYCITGFFTPFGIAGASFPAAARLLANGRYSLADLQARRVSGFSRARYWGDNPQLVEWNRQAASSGPPSGAVHSKAIEIKAVARIKTPYVDPRLSQNQSNRNANVDRIGAWEPKSS